MTAPIIETSAAIQRTGPTRSGNEGIARAIIIIGFKKLMPVALAKGIRVAAAYSKLITIQLQMERPKCECHAAPLKFGWRNILNIIIARKAKKLPRTNLRSE